MSEVVIFRPEDEWKPLAKLKAKADITLLPESLMSECRAASGLLRTRTAYRRHPHRPEVLVVFDQFEDFVLDARYKEAIRVLTVLGASRVSCESLTSSTSGFKSRLSVSGVRVGGGAARERTQASSFSYKMTGTGGAPQDPRPLQWPGEPGLEAAVHSVLANGATDVSIVIHREKTSNAVAHLRSQLADLDVSLGGGHHRSTVDTLRFEASFPARGSARR